MSLVISFQEHSESCVKTPRGKCLILFKNLKKFSINKKKNKRECSKIGLKGGLWLVCGRHFISE